MVSASDMDDQVSRRIRLEWCNKLIDNDEINSLGKGPTSFHNQLEINKHCVLSINAKRKLSDSIFGHVTELGIQFWFSPFVNPF